jgi:hypothetical protein
VQINRQAVAGFFVGSLLALLATGCGSSYPLGTVTGTVTLDGKPLPQATVTFSRGQGRMSVGTTDEQGRYKLLYTVNQQGAEPGTHTVSITTQIDAVSGEGDLAAVEGRKELLPPRYNDKTELTAEVKRGRNTIDFDLTSTGK